MVRRYLIAVLLLCSLGHAATVYIAATAGTFTGGTACNGQTAVTPGSVTWTAGNTYYLCGTFTGSAGATIVTVNASGTSGSPITILFDTGAILQAPYCNGSNGCLDIHGQSWITVNGQNTGTIQNTANGDGLANQHISIGVFEAPCTSCIVENLTIANIYVAIQNFGSPLGGAATQMNAIVYSGQNNTISGNVIHDCGWCVYTNYGSGDTNVQIFNNVITNWDHAAAYATGSAISCTAPCFIMHDNQFGSNLNWETSGCTYHLDGLHTFGVAGSTMNGVYIYNNWFHGLLSGACSSGFIFMEQGSPSMSNASNTYVWNNVFDASQADGADPNGWVGLFSGLSGVTQVFNNTLLCPNFFDNTTAGWSIQQQGAALTFENNVEQQCPQGINIGTFSGGSTATLDYNIYGGPCGASNNCFYWKGTSEGTFSAFQTACSCDAHSSALYEGRASINNTAVTWSSGPQFVPAMVGTNTFSLFTSSYHEFTVTAYNSPTSITVSPSAGGSFSANVYSSWPIQLNSDGSPQTGSPIILQGADLSSFATGNLATLANDTTKGNTRVTIARPATGTCTSQGSLPCWDIGAYQYSAVVFPGAAFGNNIGIGANVGVH